MNHTQNYFIGGHDSVVGSATLWLLIGSYYTMLWWLCAVPAIIFLHGWTFILTHGSTPSKDKSYNQFVMRVSSPRGAFDFIKSLFSYGYLKLSFGMMVKHYMNLVLPIKTARVGRGCEDAKLICLDGKERSLLLDYVFPNVKSKIPLVLNFGSYT